MPIQSFANEVLAKIFSDGVAMDRQLPIGDNMMFKDIAGFAPEITRRQLIPDYVSTNRLQNMISDH